MCSRCGMYATATFMSKCMLANKFIAENPQKGVTMNKYVIVNTNTKESEKVYSENSQEAKKAVCRTKGWKTAECSVRMITR